MSTPACHACRAPKGEYRCGICEAALCKRCVQVLEKDSFPLLPERDEALSHTLYCGSCYLNRVAPALEDYQDLVERAKAVIVFTEIEGTESRYVRSSEKPLTVAECSDRKEALLRLALLAARAKFNALIHVRVTAKKIRSDGYQHSQWSAQGIPARVDASRFVSQR